MAAAPVAVAFLALALVSTAYWGYALRCIGRFQRRRQGAGAFLPPVTVLKPLCGAHPGLYESLRSFCVQDYPADVQILFGVRDPADPAVDIVLRLIDEHRARTLKLVVNERDVSVNPKVSNLVGLYASAEHDVLVVADSDIRVGPDYLRAAVAPLAEPGVGLVTCLYRAGGTGRGWGALARLFIDEWFFPSALVSATGAMRHAFGATLAFRRGSLEAIGGFEAVGPYLADDYMLGERIAARGERVVLSPYVVETRVVERSFAALFFHELRWSRTMRAVRPIGYFLAAVTYGFVWSALALVVTGGAWPAVAVAAVHAGLRLAVHRAAQRALAGPAAAVWLLPVRDALSLLLWAAAFTGRTVRWGRHRFVVDLLGRLTRR
jgi:ceramide glucosyltransferase